MSIKKWANHPHVANWATCENQRERVSNGWMGLSRTIQSRRVECARLGMLGTMSMMMMVVMVVIIIINIMPLATAPNNDGYLIMVSMSDAL